MSIRNAAKVAAIVRDAGGRVVGRTRLQKIAYLLTITGLEGDFTFSYKHYGPFSEEVATAARHAGLLGRLQEEEHTASWGGSYSVYSVEDEIPNDVPQARRRIAALSAEADAVELELAATAVYLSLEGYDDPWAETKRRKPEKSDRAKLKGAKALLKKLRGVQSPQELPDIN